MPGRYITEQDSPVARRARRRISTASTSTRTVSCVGGRVVGARHAGDAFAGARLVDVELVRCDLAGCDFSESAFHRVRLVDCRCIGDRARRRDVALGHDRRLPVRRRQLPNGAADAGALRRDRCAPRADFGGARLDDVQFPGCDLTGADVSNARCSDVDLRGARLDGLRGRRVAAWRDDRCRPAVRARARTGCRDRAASARPRTTDGGGGGSRYEPGTELRAGRYNLRTADGPMSSLRWPDPTAQLGTDRPSTRTTSRGRRDDRRLTREPGSAGRAGPLRPALRARQLRRRLRRRHAGSQEQRDPDPGAHRGVLPQPPGRGGRRGRHRRRRGRDDPDPRRVLSRGRAVRAPGRRARTRPASRSCRSTTSTARCARSRRCCSTKASRCSVGVTCRSTAEVPGKSAREVMPAFRQVFVEKNGITGVELERHVYVARKHLEHAVPVMLGTNRGGVYFPSLSARVVCYKGMLTPNQLQRFYRDLQDPRVETALALVHSRFSHQHVPELAARASVPHAGAQRRDQHRAGQRELDARARRRDAVGPAARRPRRVRSRSARPARPTPPASTKRSSCSTWRAVRCTTRS